MSGLRADDIVIYNDADEIPNLNTILFLKHYEGYPQPIEFAYRYTENKINFTCSMNSSGNRKVRHEFNNRGEEEHVLHDSAVETIAHPPNSVRSY